MPTTKSAKPISTRERILGSAKHLFQQRGYFAVGTVEILKHAKAPKGSMYHHFPGGKEQIAIAVVREISADVAALMKKLASAEQPVANILRALAKGMAQWLKDSAWREGTMLATTTVGSVPDLPKLHAVIRNAFDEWRAHIATLLAREDWPKQSAEVMAHMIIATIEGAMILARVDQDETILIKIVDRLARVVAAGPDAE
jgi:TetR/AcrR family transcriptional repressor of lmrAB and yxaGH operons